MLLIGQEKGKGPIGKIPGQSPDKSGKSWTKGQNQPADRSHVKKRRKVAKIFFDTFRAGQKTSKIVNNNIFDAFRGETKGRFRKRAVWANVPSLFFWYRGTCACTIVPVFGTGEHPNVPSFRFLVPGNIRQNHPFVNPRTFRTAPIFWPLFRAGPKGVSTKGVSMKRPNFPKFRHSIQ